MWRTLLEPVLVCRRPSEVTVWDFQYYALAPEDCDGDYQPELHLRVVGGRLGPLQLSRLGSDMSLSQTAGDVGGRMIGPGSFDESRSSRDVAVYVWPKQERPCGAYAVTLEFQSEFPVTISPNPANVTIDHDGQHKVVRFDGVMDLGAGGPPPPPQEEEPGEGQPSEEAPAEFPQDGFPEEYPLDFGAPQYPESVTDELWSGAESLIDPLAALRGGFSLGAAPHDVSTGPPWTQLDIVVDPNASMDARDAVNLHDIEGTNIVRGLFDGRFRGFSAGV
jgi:hypothetical protein